MGYGKTASRDQYIRDFGLLGHNDDEEEDNDEDENDDDVDDVAMMMLMTLLPQVRPHMRDFGLLAHGVRGSKSRGSLCYLVEDSWPM